MGLSTLLDDILERNRAFTRGRQPRPLPPAEGVALAIVACYDPRLGTLLREAVGLAPGEAFLLRTAGAAVPPTGEILRSLGLAIFMFGVTDVLIIGHSSCRMARFDAARFSEIFRARGVERSAFGDADLREWANAIPSVSAAVQRSVENVAAAPFVPKDVEVSGLVLDDSTGSLTVVARGGRRAADS